MTAVTKALEERKFQRPMEFLNIGFKHEVDFMTSRNVATSRDDRILTNVIRKRVLVDCHLIGGTPTTVPVEYCDVIQTNPNEFVVNVPKDLTSNKSIVNVLSLVANMNYIGSSILPSPAYDTSPILGAATTMYNSMKTVNLIQTSRLELIGENTIIVSEPHLMIFNAFLKVNLEYDDSMSTLNPRFMRGFSKACVLATKAWLYNKLVVIIDQSRLYAGHDLSIITDIINSYSDAEEQYQEYVDMTLKKLLLMSNKDTMTRMVSSMIGGII